MLYFNSTNGYIYVSIFFIGFINTSFSSSRFLSFITKNSARHGHGTRPLPWHALNDNHSSNYATY